MTPRTPDNPLVTQTNYPEQVRPPAQLQTMQDSLSEVQAVSRSAYGDTNLDQADAVSTINVQSWFNHTPWRITAGWSAVAGLLAAGVLTNLYDWRTFFGWQTLVLTLLLVDPLWGSIWRFAWGRDGILPLGKGQQSYGFWLPFLRANSPAARLMGIYDTSVATDSKAGIRTGNGSAGDEITGQSPQIRQGTRGTSDGDLAPLLFRIGLPTLFVTYGVAATLGNIALWFTSIVVVCAVLGWLGRRSWGKPSGLLQAIVFTLLPWALMSLLLQQGLTPEQAQYGNTDKRITYGLLLALLWTLHCWGITLARRKRSAMNMDSSAASEAEHSSALVARTGLTEAESDRNSVERLSLTSFRSLFSAPALPVLILADVGIVALMINLQEPLWLALLVPLWLPTWLAYMQSAPVDRQPVWRLAALLVSAVAIGLTPLL